jgi:hypothetical protein
MFHGSAPQIATIGGFEDNLDPRQRLAWLQNSTRPFRSRASRTPQHHLYRRADANGLVHHAVAFGKLE